MISVLNVAVTVATLKQIRCVLAILGSFFKGKANKYSLFRVHLEDKLEINPH